MTSRYGSPAESVGTAEAKRRFSEWVDRVGEGERFLVSRRGRPAVALVPPTPDLPARRDSERLGERVRELVHGALTVLPFDESAAVVYGRLRAHLEAEGERLDEPDLRIASIALSRELTLVTGNVRHFARVPGLDVEDWLSEGRS
jgi:prevent-host-death family protein